MTTWDKPLSDVTEQDLQALVANKVVEQRTLDYKRDLPGGLDKDKVKLRADASSFANAAGGFLVFGVNAPHGVPTDLCGVEVADADAEILRLEGIIRAGIKPRIPGLASRAVPLASGRSVVLIHIPRSWAGPHWAENTSDWTRFYSRNSNGKYVLDIGEVRAAFLRSETFAERVRAFRADRLARVVAGDMPYLLPDTAKLVLHVVPFGAFDTGTRFDLTPPEQNIHLLATAHPIGTLAASGRYNFDGYLRYGENNYVQIFRNGCLEAVDASTLKPHGERRIIPSIVYEQYTASALQAYLLFQKQLGVELPLLVMLSLVGVRRYRMAVRQSLISAINSRHDIDRDVLVVPEELVTDFESKAEQVLKPSFDAVWNAAGWPRSMNYDDQGQWIAGYQ